MDIILAKLQKNFIPSLNLLLLSGIFVNTLQSTSTKTLNIMDVAERSDIWFAVVNVYAASKKASGFWTKAEARLKADGIVYHGNRTGRSGNAMEIAFDACMAGYRKFLAVGGDGTVHDVLNGIAAYVDWAVSQSVKIDMADFTMGVLPLGSGNDWIKSTGVPKNLNKAVDILSDPTLMKQDVVRVSALDPDNLDKVLSVSYMANIGGIGIDARVCERVNAQKSQGKRGKILYVTSLLHAIKNRVPSLAKVICDGEVVFDGAYLSMAFGVGMYSGGGMRQTPAAVLDDGLLDMTIIPDLPLKRIAREVPRLFTGTFLKVPELVVSKSKVITVVPSCGSSAEPAEVDGEVIGKVPVRFEVLDSQINIVVGKGL